MKKYFLMITFISAFATQLFAQTPGIVTSTKPGWHKIGEVTADFKAEKDQILVLGADRFKSIKLKVTDAPIHLYDLEVFYEAGDNEHIQVRQELQKGSETRTIDLRGNSRSLKKVVLTYKTMPNVKDEKAHVELYGLK